MLIPIRASSLPALMADPSHTDLASSTCWCPPTLRPFTKPGFGISRRDHSGPHPALRHATAEPALYRRHARQEAGRTGRTEESGRHRGAQRVGAEAVVEAQRVAAAKTACPTTVRHGELSHGHRGLFAEAPDSMASSRPGRCSPGATASVFATEESAIRGHETTRGTSRSCRERPAWINVRRAIVTWAFVTYAF